MNAGHIREVIEHFLLCQPEGTQFFFFLELPVPRDRESQLRQSTQTPLHRDVYTLGKLELCDALILLDYFAELLIHDGLSIFGFGLRDGSAEIMLDKYNVMSLWAEKPEDYRDFWQAHDIPEVPTCSTAWDTFSPDRPGRCRKICVEGRTVFDLPKLLEPVGMKLVDCREE